MTSKIETVKKLNGFGLHSWSDVVSIISLLAILIAIVMTYSLTKAEITVIQRDVTEIKTSVAVGILPRAEERIDALTNVVNKNTAEIEKNQERIDKEKQ